MDPRHPELAVSRVKELINQYDRIEKDMANATTSAQLAQLEREGGLVVQEICLVAPRMHEALMQTSRQRRHQLAMGITYVPTEKVGKYIKATIGIQEKPVEKPKLTLEEEEDFARLLVILGNAKKQFEGKDARNKETGEVYTNLYFLTIKPFSADNLRYGIIVSMNNGKEVLSFGNEKVIDFLNNYEPVENFYEEVREYAATAKNVEPKPKKKTTSKKKTTKKSAEK